MKTIAELAAACRSPVSIKPEEKLRSATTLLLLNDFSQLPVMKGPRDIKGMISWKSIGAAQIQGLSDDAGVKDCISPHRLLSYDMDFLEAIEEIIKHECIMVKSKNGEIKGPVTLFDISVEHLYLTQPFILLGNIENYLRKVIDHHLTPESFLARFSEVSEKIKTSEDLSFSQYTRALNEEQLKKSISQKYDLSAINKLIDDINDDRNAIMHFRTHRDLEAMTEKLSLAEKFFKGWSISMTQGKGL